MKYRPYILFLIMILAFCPLFAQKTQFVASAPASVTIGQQFQYTIEGNEKGEVILPEVQGIEFIGGPFTSFSSSTKWVNGKMTVQTSNSFTYICRANNEGELLIPPAVVRVKRDEFKTNEVRITVSGTSAGLQEGTSTQQSAGNESMQGKQESEPVFLRIIPSSKEVYQGEQLVSELKIYTRVNTRPTQGLKDIPYEGFFKQVIDPDQTSQREVINGEVYVTQVLQRHILIPQKPGKMVIEPFESEWTIPQRIQRQRSGSMLDEFFNDPFSDPFFSGVQNVPVALYTKPVTINVKPFPDAAPEGFTGGVGNLKMSATLTESNVSENDALSLIIKITGRGNINLIGPPKVDFPPDHDIYEPTRSEKISTSGNRLSGTVTFEYPMVARHAGNFRIPPVKFTWFDPGSKSFKTSETTEFQFIVAKGEDSDISGQVYVPGMSAEKVENLGTDILDIQRVSPVFYKIDYSPLGKIWYWLLFAGSAVLFFITGGLLRLYFKRRADVRLVRNRKASSLARKRLKKADKARKAEKSGLFYEETEKAIWGYLADKLGLEPASLNRDTVQDVLADSALTKDDTDELFRIVDECELSRYAPSAEKSDMNQLYQSSVKLIDHLEHKIQQKR